MKKKTTFGMSLKEIIEFNNNAVELYEQKKITSLDYFNRRFFTLLQLGKNESTKKSNKRQK